MRRYLLLLSILLFGGTLLVSAADEDSPAPGGVPVTVPHDSQSAGLFGPLQPAVVPVELERMAQAPQLTLAPVAHASDFCSNATPLAMIDGTDGDSSNVLDMTTSPSDPALTCMYGNPFSSQGYRTAWYRFEAPASGRLVATTSFDPSDYQASYDTVLALYHATEKGDVDLACDSLRMIACDDDTEGFLSEVRAFVQQGEWYFIEVADWHFSADGYELRLGVVLEDVEPLWTRLSGEPWLPRSRHMVVTNGTHIYILGGEKEVEEIPQVVPDVARFTPATGAWNNDLYPVPLLDLPGYSRTTAAYLGGNIYIPAGYVGNNQYYWGAHLRYNIPSDTWSEVAPVPWDTVPYAWSEAVSVPSRNGYYLAGGLVSGDPDPAAGEAQPVGRLLFYSAPGNTWNTQLPDMSQARYAHVAGGLNSPQGRKVCVAGGVGRNEDDQMVILQNAECYNFGTNDWSDIAPLNIARFSSGSAVGPDGRWYVFGGITVSGTGDDQEFVPVTETEVYDPVTNTWRMLDARYSIDEPGRAWTRGVFVGDTLWIFGGEMVPNSEVVPLIESLYLPQNNLHFPLLMARKQTAEPNSTFAEAIPIALRQTVSQDFRARDDFFDVFRFRVTNPGVYKALVQSIPAGRNYDVYLYNANKYFVGKGEAIGNNDELAYTLPLNPGIYYAVVVRVYGGPTSDQYTITILPPGS